MAVVKPGYTLPNVASEGATTHIADHNFIRAALLELKDDFVVPDGGVTGQVLSKASDTSGDLSWVDQTGGSGGGGTTDHSLLTNRNLANQHTTAAITGLDAALTGKAASVHTHATSSITSGTFTAAFLPAGLEFVADKTLNGGTYPSRTSLVGSRTDLKVVWIGDTDPANAINGDRWIKTA